MCCGVGGWLKEKAKNTKNAVKHPRKTFNNEKHRVEDTVKDTVDDGWDKLKDAAGDIWDNVGKPLVEKFFNLLGFHDEDVFSAAATVSFIGDQNADASKILKRVIINAINKNEDITESILYNTAASTLTYAQLKTQSDKMNSDHDDYKLLMNINLVEDEINEDDLKNAIADKYSVNKDDITILNKSYTYPETLHVVLRTLTDDYALDMTGTTVTVDDEKYIIDESAGTVTDDKIEVVAKQYILRKMITQTQFRLQNGTYTKTVTRLLYDRKTDELVSSTVLSTEVIMQNVDDNRHFTKTSEVVSTYNEVSATTTIEIDYDTSKKLIVSTFQVNEVDGVFIYDLDDGTYDIDVKDADANVKLCKTLPILCLRDKNTWIDDTSDKYKDYQKLATVEGQKDLHTLTNAIDDNDDIDKVMNVYLGYFINYFHMNSKFTSAYLYYFLDYIKTYGNRVEEDVDNGDGTTTKYYSYQILVDKGNNLQTGFICTDITTEIVDDDSGKEYWHEINDSDLTVHKAVGNKKSLKLTATSAVNMDVIDNGNGDHYVVSVGINANQDDNQFTMPIVFEVVECLPASYVPYLLQQSLALKIYAGETQHLKYYQTNSFALFMEFCGIVGMMVGIPPEATWTDLLIDTAIEIGVKYTLKYVFEHTDNDVIRAIAVAVAIYVNIKFVLNSPSYTQMVTTGVQTVSYANNVDLAIRYNKMQAIQNENESIQQKTEDYITQMRKELGLVNNDMIDASTLITAEKTYNRAYGQPLYNYKLLYSDYSAEMKSPYDYTNMYM